MHYARFRMLLLLVAGVVVLLVLFLPIRVPQVLEVPGRVLPVREWLLTRGNEGQVIATLRNHVSGTVEAYATTEPARGDAVRFTLNPAVSARRAVAAGDTVGLFTSSELDQQWARLSGDLLTARASLALFRTGEKAAVVAEARQRLLESRERAAQQRRVVERQRPLYEQQLIAAELFEAAESVLRQYELAAEAAEARLQAVQTGAKAEQVALEQARVRALEEQRRVLAARRTLGALVSPIAGFVARSFSADTLLSVADTSAYVVVMPVAWKDRAHVRPAQEVTLRVPSRRPSLRGTVLYVDPSARTFNGGAFLMVTARIEPAAAALTPGLPARCSLATASRSLRDYAWQSVRDLFDR